MKTNKWPDCLCFVHINQLTGYSSSKTRSDTGKKNQLGLGKVFLNNFCK